VGDGSDGAVFDAPAYCPDGADAHAYGIKLNQLVLEKPQKEATMDERAKLLRRIRFLMAAFLVGLVLSGITAFPLVWEVGLLARWLGIDPAADPSRYTGLLGWIALVHQGVTETDSRYPFMAYGTDWLAFGHLVIALFLIGPLREPVRNLWCLRVGMAACVLVIPLALICGPIRGIPFGWQCIDSAFGVIGIVPLWLAFRATLRLEVLEKTLEYYS
jgi:hypothetical protein